MNDVLAYRIDGTTLREMSNDIIEVGKKVLASTEKFVVVDVITTRFRDDVSSFGQFDSDFCKFVKINDVLFMLLDTYGVSVNVDNKLRPIDKRSGLSYIIQNLIEDFSVSHGVHCDIYGNTSHVYISTRDGDSDVVQSLLSSPLANEIGGAFYLEDKYLYCIASLETKRLEDYEKAMLRMNRDGVGEWLSENAFEDDIYQAAEEE